MNRRDLDWRTFGLLSLFAFLGAVGCEQKSSRTAATSAPPVATAAAAEPSEILTADELRRQLRTDERAKFRRVGTDIVEAHLFRSGVRSIEPLKGLPLRFLDLGFCESISDLSVVAGMPLKTLILEGTSVADLSPISGMSLEVLYLQDTPVTDLSVISGMPLRELNLKNVRVSDAAPFTQLPLSTLWLPGTEVADISPLQLLSLESLDIQDTPVSDLRALAKMTSLKRLNIAGTQVTDVKPITGLRLHRIILTPDRITDGMSELRNMKSLGQIWTSHDNQMTADAFWERYDLGVWDSETSQPVDAGEQESPAADGDQDSDSDDRKTSETEHESAASESSEATLPE